MKRDGLRGRVVLLLGAGLAAACSQPPAATGGKPSASEQAQQADQFAARYCAACHSEAGQDRSRPRAHRIFDLDAAGKWQGSRRILLAVLDKWHLDGKIMPPPRAHPQPSDDERRAIIDWIARGAPGAAGADGNAIADRRSPGVQSK
jgi:cytochrome c5